ncbi:MAG TPA: methylated-DNA--[protein]-cysteine S-methyltransferase [Candidatus Deferrimicrobium sp.]|nr:methylated-DNA--[protein]-cysteine S-methyltransferase [Candidatus Deferrimicrobium sp.]
MKKLFVHSFKTALGTVRTAATEKGLALIVLPSEPRGRFEKRIQKMFPGYEIAAGGPINKKAEKQLTAYLRGRQKKFTLKLDLHMAPFHRRVLAQVARIPYGKTMTYGAVASAIGNPRASRAVGNANARNDLPLVIPCHRVVASTGLGGYGGGLGLKKKLLRLEGAL